MKNKLIKILKVLVKGRTLAGVIPFLTVLWLASLQDVSVYWSIPTGLWCANVVGFIYEFITENK